MGVRHHRPSLTLVCDNQGVDSLGGNAPAKLLAMYGDVELGADSTIFLRNSMLFQFSFSWPKFGQTSPQVNVYQCRRVGNCSSKNWFLRLLKVYLSCLVGCLRTSSLGISSTERQPPGSRLVVFEWESPRLTYDLPSLIIGPCLLVSIFHIKGDCPAILIQTKHNKHTFGDGWVYGH